MSNKPAAPSTRAKLGTGHSKILFFGTPDFATIVLEKLAQSQPILAVATAPDKPVGRKRILTPPPVKVLAQKLNISVLQPENVKNQEFIKKIKELVPDVIIVTAYGQILPKELLDIPKHGALNIHPSLLPKYRGASPIQVTILVGEEKTGVTIILMDEKMDHGPILAQRELEFPISPLGRAQRAGGNFQFPKLNEKLAKLSAELLIETLPKWVAGEIKPIPQDHSKATFTRRIKKEDGLIDWSKNASEIEKMTRAYWPWPGAYADFNNKVLKIIKAHPNFEETWVGKAGTVFLTKDKELAVGCGEGSLIIEELQLEGKRKMTAQEFLNGHPEIIDTILF